MVSVPQSRKEEEDERLLVRRGAEGDRAALDALYARHADAVHRLAFRIAGDADIAADTTQDTFIRAFRELAAFRGDSSLATWLHSIATSVALSSRRRTTRRAKYHAPIESAATVGRADLHGDAILRSRLYDAIDALPRAYRVVFIMYAIEGHTHPDIASILGISTTTSQGYLFRARAQLRLALADLAGDLHEGR